MISVQFQHEFWHCPIVQLSHDHALVPIGYSRLWSDGYCVKTSRDLEGCHWNPRPETTELVSNMFEYSGSWFGTFFHILGLIIPTDFHIFQRGWNDQPGLVFVSSPTGRMYWHHIWHYCMNIWHYIFDNMDMGQNPSNPFGSHQYIAEISGCSSPL